MTPAPAPFAEAVLFLHSYLGTCLRPHWWHALVFRGEASSVEPSAPPASAIRPVGGDPSLVVPGCRLFVPGCRLVVPVVPVPIPVAHDEDAGRAELSHPFPPKPSLRRGARRSRLSPRRLVVGEHLRGAEYLGTSS